MKNENFNYLIT